MGARLEGADIINCIHHSCWGQNTKNPGWFVGSVLLLLCSNGSICDLTSQRCCSLRCRGEVTSAQYCCLVSESMWANPPSTSAFIRDLCTELDSRWSGGLRLANCFARFHQLSHCTTMFALDAHTRRQTTGFRQIYHFTE